MIYYKQCSGTLLPQKAAELQNWVQWTHHSEGKTHCEECLKLDGCWFQKGNAPPCPHHPFCHCTLECRLVNEALHKRESEQSLFRGAPVKGTHGEIVV